MSQHRVKASLYQPGSISPQPVISLPLRGVPGHPADWTGPDWEDNGWNKAMRDAAKRLALAGFPVVLLEPDSTTPPAESGDSTKSHP